MSPFPKQHLMVGGDDPFLPSLLAAINHADTIEITTAFIRCTGLDLIKEALMEAIERRAKVRILTGDYLSVTEPQALRYLMLMQEAGAEVRIFESGNIQSFHMKAYIFRRMSGSYSNEGCAFVGSSNISRSALKHGLEWNLRVDWAENEERFKTILDQFEAVFTREQTKVLTHEWIDVYEQRVRTRLPQKAFEPGADESLEPVVPNEVQVDALEALVATREQGYVRGLVVMATGLGKTWLAAFDTKQLDAKRVLFVGHREEILDQAEATFVRIRPNAKVGRYTGRARDKNVDMLFGSVQTLGRTNHLKQFAEDYFDYVIVDEFHHAAARQYQQLLNHFRPHFLLGLTATPDRTDQADILTLCDDNMVFSRDLIAGIGVGLLCPFHYYGIGDETVNYAEIQWRSGRFDPNQLTSKLATQSRAKHNLAEWRKRAQQRTLGFCVSKRHADFMADYFNRYGVKAVSVHSDSEMRRNEALAKLRTGEIEVLFSVDLFNEGVDVPPIDTVLMLRPTESKILFLQQLGRGLRICDESQKTHLVVLDFIGNHVSFFQKAEALFRVGVTNQDRKEFLQRVEAGNLELPDGCFVNYDLTAIDFMVRLTQTSINIQEEIYQSLKSSYGRRPTLSEFFLAGGAIQTIQREHGQWLEFARSQGDLSVQEEFCLAEHASFFKELGITNLTKSYKLVLLEAMLELEGFQAPPTTELLAERSFYILQRKRQLIADLPDNFREMDSLDATAGKQWHKYWLDNPINAWVGGNRSANTNYFKQEGERFSYTKDISGNSYSDFAVLVQELINYRFLQYEERLQKRETEKIPHEPRLVSDPDAQLAIPFFEDLRIACGHFSSSTPPTRDMDERRLPSRYGKLDPSRHFIACATGNSMNGGHNPIKDGDYLLLERITAMNAGSISSQIVAIEKDDSAGGQEYLLRYVRKLGQNRYQLEAANPEYAAIDASDDMRTFARLKEIIDPSDMILHQSIQKNEVAGCFGLEYQEGLWKMSGHICPKNSPDQFLFITLNKQSADPNYRYHDYFKDQSHFHWQSQNSTTPTNKKGLGIIQHRQNGSSLHLFVRKHAKQGKKSAPFIYCGKIVYRSHTGSGPMNVELDLETPLTSEQYEYFSS